MCLNEEKKNQNGNEKIKKPWCICETGFINSCVLGKIIQELKFNAVKVVYSEKVNVPSETKYNKSIERFETIEEAIKKLIKTKKHLFGFVDRIAEKKQAKESFPSAFKKDSV